MHSEIYSVGWICALPTEAAAAKAMFDEAHDEAPRPSCDQNAYSFGCIGKHNVVVACLPAGVTGPTSAAGVAKQLCNSFPSIKIGLMVGVGGGIPSETRDIRLGDVVVSQPSDNFGGVVQYDLGKTVENGKFERTGQLNRPPDVLLTAMADLTAEHMLRGHNIDKYVSEAINKYPNMGRIWSYPGSQDDNLFRVQYDHEDKDDNRCMKCDSHQLLTRNNRNQDTPVIHYGLVASGNRVIRHGQTRNQIVEDLGAICFDMEAAGLMNNFSCLVIRGICDYADSHKNKRWQPYAAAVATAYAKELLNTIPVQEVVQIIPRAQNQGM